MSDEDFLDLMGQEKFRAFLAFVIEDVCGGEAFTDDARRDTFQLGRSSVGRDLSLMAKQDPDVYLRMLREKFDDV